MKMKKMKKTKTRWINRWAGSYTFVSCSYWGGQYYKILKRILGKGFDTTLFIHKKGTVTFLVKKDELDKLGMHLAKKVQDDKTSSIALLNKLKENTDLIMSMMAQLDGKILTLAEYKAFMKVFERHLAYHVFMKKTVDYLPQELLDEMLPQFKDARLYSEAVYSKTEHFFRELAKAIAKKEKLDAELLTCLTQKELEAYISKTSKKKLPDEKVLKERYAFSVLLCTKGKLQILTGNKAAKVEKELSEDKPTETIVRGNSASPGVAVGRCRIVLDPFSEVDFADGDILVTGMTRPEFVRFYGKAAAIVTDAGGRLCHAALIAMEMGKPCVVGTENATKVFNDGDIIHVDATNGIVRKYS